MNQDQLVTGVLMFDSEPWKPTDSEIEEMVRSEKDPLLSRMHNVVLIDDNDHTYEYVIEMLMELIGVDREKAFEMALTVDYTGRVVVFTGSKEIAERRRDEILGYGPDWRLERSRGSMSALVEPVE